MSALLPEGITRMGDMPYTLHAEINRALRVLSYEDWDVDERPPKRIWNDGQKIKEWFDEVLAKRKEKYGIKEKDEPDEGDYEENAVELVKRG